MASVCSAVSIRFAWGGLRKTGNGGTPSLLSIRGHLDFDAEFGGFEGVFLRHGVFRAVETVQNELTEELATNRVPCVNADFLHVVEEIQLVGAVVGGDIDVLPQFDGAFRAENDGLAVAP